MTEKNNSRSNDALTLDEVKNAIENSGYLIEQRVEKIFSDHDYFVEKNEVYIDEDTNKSREIDLTAFIGYEINDQKDDESVNFRFLIECENNKQPLVLFRSDSPLKFLFTQDIKVSGIPVVVKNKKGKEHHILDYLKLEDIHHYSKGFYSTQYCSFQLPKGAEKKWLACHLETQHNSIGSLIKSVKHFIIEDHDSYYVSDTDDRAHINIFFYYPLIVLQGDLVECYYKNGELQIEARQHLQFRKQEFNNGELETYQIDIVKESYLPEFLKMIKRENRRIVKLLKDKRDLLKTSGKWIAKKVRKAKGHKKAVEILRGDF